MEIVEKKKPKADFVIRLVGPGMHPWRVPMRSLTRLLDAVQRLVEQREEIDDEIPPSERAVVEYGDRVLRLLDVKNGSATYPIAAFDGTSALAVLRETATSIRSPEKSEWGPATISSIQSLSDTAKSLNCEIEFRSTADRKQYGDVIAKITPSTFAEVSGSAFVQSDTSVYGKIERVGGAVEMHCGLRLPDHPRKMIICRVIGEDLVRELGQYLYQSVIVTGSAIWIRSNWQLKKMTITSFERPKTGSIREALDHIYKAGGNAWDKVKDPAAMIGGMHGEN
ncbi:MAG: hypothetical protein ABSG31_12050 [Tepidisphaeraceae bacterium]|jgi:hypothetical protein